MLRVCVVAVFLFALAHPASAAEQRPLFDWRVSTWEPTGHVRAIAQTPDGFLWLATSAGLQRFDGRTFRVYDQRSVPALPADDVSRVLVTRGGALFVGFAHAGLLRLQGDHFVPVNGLADPRVSALVEDGDGGIWVGTPSGAHRWLSGAWTSWRSTDGLSDNVLALFTQSDGSVFVETDRGLSRFVAGKLMGSERLAPAGSEARGRRLLPTYIPGPPPPADVLARIPYIVNRALRARAGALWVATEDGLVLVEGTAVRRFGVGDGLAANATRALFESVDGSIWAASRGGGLARLSRPVLASLTRGEGLNADQAFAVARAPNGTILATTTDGLFRSDGTLLSTETFGPLSALLRGVAVAPNGDVWLGVRDSPPARVRGRDVQRFGDAVGFPRGLTTAVLATRAGGVLLGSDFGELGAIKDGKFRPSTLDRPACERRPCPSAVVALAERAAGGAWALTSRGLLRIEDDRTAVETIDPPLPPADLSTLAETADGALFVGGRAGLYRVVNGRSRRYGRADGLPDDDVRALVQDGRFLWLGCLRGLVRIETSRFAEGRALEPALFDARDGVRGSEIVGGFGASGVRADDGRLWFATVRGLAVVESSALWPRPRLSPLRIDVVRVDGVPVPANLLAKRPPGRGAVEIAFATAALDGPHHVQVRHQLVGFDRDWIDAGPSTTASYTNLPPGTYTFRAQSRRDDDLGGHSEEASVSFSLAPHFHQTWAFVGLVGLGIVALALGIQRLRMRQVARRFALALGERERIGRDLHDALAQVFTAATLHLDRLRAALKPEEDEAQRRAQQTRQILQHGRLAARRVVANLRTGRDNLVLARALEDLPKLFEDVHFSITAEGNQPPLAADLQTELLRIAEEAVSNAVAHGRARRIALDLVFDGEGTTLRVRDDGEGFVPQAPHAPATPGGLGLLGMRERASRLGGRLEVTSEPGVGSEVCVVVPSPRGNRS